MMRMAADSAAARPPPPIAAGEAVIRALVTLTATISGGSGGAGVRDSRRWTRPSRCFLSRSP